MHKGETEVMIWRQKEGMRRTAALPPEQEELCEQASSLPERDEGAGSPENGGLAQGGRCSKG